MLLLPQQLFYRMVKSLLQPVFLNCNLLRSMRINYTTTIFLLPSWYLLYWVFCNWEIIKYHRDDQYLSKREKKMDFSRENLFLRATLKKRVFNPLWFYISLLSIKLLYLPLPTMIWSVILIPTSSQAFFSFDVVSLSSLADAEKRRFVSSPPAGARPTRLMRLMKLTRLARLTRLERRLPDNAI